MPKYFQKFIIASAVLFFPLVLSAAGIEVSPSKLEISSSGEENAFLDVRNPTKDVQIFEVYADDFQEIINIKPSSFILEAGQEKKVRISIKKSQPKESTIQTNISVTAKQMADTHIQFRSGVKIPVTAGVAAQKFSQYKIFIYGSIIAIIALALFIFFQQKKGRKTPQSN